MPQPTEILTGYFPPDGSSFQQRDAPPRPAGKCVSGAELLTWGSGNSRTFPYRHGDALWSALSSSALTECFGFPRSARAVESERESVAPAALRLSSCVGGWQRRGALRARSHEVFAGTVLCPARPPHSAAHAGAVHPATQPKTRHHLCFFTRVAQHPLDSGLPIGRARPAPSVSGCVRLLLTCRLLRETFLRPLASDHYLCLVLFRTGTVIRSYFLLLSL